MDEIIAWRMTKKQQMRWNKATVQPLLDVRAAVLNNTLEHAFRRVYADFQPANDGLTLQATTRSPFKGLPTLLTYQALTAAQFR